MINEDLLEILRCPLSPSTARLLLKKDGLECERCALRFHITDGFPILVVEEAELPLDAKAAVNCHVNVSQRNCP